MCWEMFSSSDPPGPTGSHGYACMCVHVSVIDFVVAIKLGHACDVKEWFMIFTT